ncbi:MAG: phage terminase large subunit [Chitinophagaceae bacterium]|nr:phage terminase large subunit [Chitinophagaceae bacterium]
MTNSISNNHFNALLAQGCKQDFFTFVKTFWHSFVAEPPIWNWHIEHICKELQQVGEAVKERKPCEFDYFILNVPPGSSKSSIISILYPLWCWIIDPSQRFICGSYSATIAEDLADKSRKVFISDLYRELFPFVGVVSEAKTKLENAHFGERYTVSTGSSVTGVHASQIIIDDPLNALQATSEAERQTANKWITETLSSRKTDKKVTPTIIVMQRLHEDDPTGYLLSKNLRIKRICLPAELSEDVYPESLKDFYIDGLMDIKRLDRDVLDNAKANLGSYAYAGQYQQTPVDLSGGLFKRDWFEIMDNVPKEGATINFQLDTAFTAKTENDPTGVLSYFRKGEYVYITGWVSKRLEFPELVAFIKTYTAEMGYSHKSKIRIEPKASGLPLIQQLKNETNLNIIASPNPVKDKVTRATEILSKCEAGRVRLIRGNWNETFLNEVCMFPKGKHDEAVDCLTEVVREELLTEQVQNLYNILGRFA